jgi:hypothetical protein
MHRLWRFAGVAFAAFGFSGCQAFRAVNKVAELPPTLAQTHTSYSYIPLDPLPVTIAQGNNCRDLIGFVNGVPQFANGTPLPVLESLSDQA